MPTKVELVTSDYYGAIYKDGVLTDQAKPEYLDIETLARLYPNAAVYLADSDVADGDGYPAQFADIDPSKLTLVRPASAEV